MRLPLAGAAARPFTPAHPALGRGISAAIGIDAAPAVLHDTSSLIAFADQGSNLAGLFFQASLLPYVGFLYFLAFPGNRTPKAANFGFQFLLLFVFSTVATGIISKSVYASSLANVDWLHGGAETLLTCSNLYVSLGFRAAVANPLASPEEEPPVKRTPAWVLAAGVVALVAVGPTLGLGAHDPFLAGLGNLPADMLTDIPLRAEPVNALSVPTWLVHYSSVLEFLFAMSMVWQYAEITGNPRWRGLTWGMLPLHASGIAACTYHFFFNAPELAFLVTMQAALTLLGNTTLCIAAARIALSTGWTPSELIPPPLRGDKQEAAPVAAQPASAAPAPASVQPLPLLVAELVLLTLFAAYGTKYGELLVGLPFEPNAIVAGGLVVGIPALVANGYFSASKSEAQSA